MFEDILGNGDLTLAEKNQREIEKIWEEEEEESKIVHEIKKIYK